MIGKAIHKILLGSISDLESGNVIPVVIPQQPKDDYPQVIYGLYNEMLVSKDKNPNIKCCDLSLRIVGKTYKSCEDLARKIRDILDHLEDHQTHHTFLFDPVVTVSGPKSPFLVGCH